VQAAEDTQEDFLAHVLGVLPVPEDADAEPEHFGLEPLDELANGRGISLLAAANKRGVVGHGDYSEGIPHSGAAGFSLL
jgi:hypothetical protein